MKRVLIVFAILAAATPAAADTVSGTVRYQNRIYDDNGFTGGLEFLPVRFADVQFIRESDGTVLGADVTDGLGAYSITFPGSETGFLRVFARNNGAVINAVVMNNSFDQLIYTAASVTVATIPATTINFDVLLAGGAPPFKIFDVIVGASDAHSLDHPTVEQQAQADTMTRRNGTVDPTRRSFDGSF